MTGKKFGRLTVLARVEGPTDRARWLVICTCGTQKVVIGASLRRGHTRSCGCLPIEIIRAAQPLAALKNTRKVVDGKQLDCPGCGQRKALREFDTNNGNKRTGKSSHCKDCRHHAHIRSTYGLSREAYAALKAKKGGKCWIEGCESRGEHVDHCHRLNVVRGWLCAYCNRALVRDVSPEVHRGRAAYLEQFEEDAWLLDIE
jgi:hypothetical protein